MQSSKNKKSQSGMEPGYLVRDNKIENELRTSLRFRYDAINRTIKF
jgi:hypothetical protein